jgi:hypothetical protein
MASGIYNRFKANLMNKEVDLEADTIKVALLDTDHTFTATNTVWSDISSNDLTTAGTGYTAGGATLSGKAVTEGATTKWDAVDVQWTGSTFTAYHAVVYDTTVSNNLIASYDFGGAQTVTSGTFTIQWSTDGLITLA